MTPALDALTTALCDVDNLIEHHPKAIDPGRGRPVTDEGPLLRSCVLLTYAAWEVYIEDGLIWAVEKLACQSFPDQLPEALRTFVADAVGSDPWKLAGDSWRETTVGAVTVRVRGTEEDDSFGVNTAGPRQVIALHDQVLGARLLNYCRWQKMPVSRVKEELASLVRIRGSIAHTGQPPGSLDLKGVRSWRAFVQRLASQLDQQLERWVGNHLPS
jgi:hypothetical protein